MIFLWATVRSTGTRFMQSVLRDAKQKCYLLGNTEPGSQLSDGVHFSHCMPIHMKIIENRARKHPLFLNMRHPYRVAESWHKRGWKIGPLFFAQWWNLFHLHDAYDGIWVPVDTEDRIERLARASELIGVELQTDWTPGCPTTDIVGRPEGSMDLQDAQAILKTMPFEQFGYTL